MVEMKADDSELNLYNKQYNSATVGGRIVLPYGERTPNYRLKEKTN
jgi:hypothetical protein